MGVVRRASKKGAITIISTMPNDRLRSMGLDSVHAIDSPALPRPPVYPSLRTLAAPTRSLRHDQNSNLRNRRPIRSRSAHHRRAKDRRELCRVAETPFQPTAWPPPFRSIDFCVPLSEIRPNTDRSNPIFLMQPGHPNPSNHRRGRDRAGPFFFSRRRLLLRRSTALPHEPESETARREGAKMMDPRTRRVLRTGKRKRSTICARTDRQAAHADPSTHIPPPSHPQSRPSRR